MLPAYDWFENVSSWWDIPTYETLFNYFPFGVFVSAIWSALVIVLGLKIFHFLIHG